MPKEKLHIGDLVSSVRDYDFILRGQASNEHIAQHLEELALGSRSFGEYAEAKKLELRAFRLRTCMKIIDYDSYGKIKTALYNKTYHCRDRLCLNCAKLVSNSRERKFMGKVTTILNDYSFWHMVTTSPNCVGLSSDPTDTRPSLTNTVLNMRRAISYLNDYLKGKKKITGLDFSYLGYAGAVRSFECTMRVLNEYHPHYHIILALKKDLWLDDKHENDYSKSRNSSEKTYFSDFEILLQKIWKLLMTGQTVTKKALDKMDAAADIGYSCRCKLIEDDKFHQAFKYPFKPDGIDYIDINTFNDIEHSLKNVRAVQSSGIFLGMKIDETDIDDTEWSLSERIRDELYYICEPSKLSESPSQSRLNIVNDKRLYLSLKKIGAFERDLADEGIPVSYELVTDLLAILKNHDFTPKQKRDWLQMSFDQYKEKYKKDIKK